VVNCDPRILKTTAPRRRGTIHENPVLAGAGHHFHWAPPPVVAQLWLCGNPQDLRISIAMPTVMVIDGWRFHFFANEGPRPHIHVVKGDAAAKVWLDDQSLADWDNLTKSDRRRILKMVAEHEEQLQEAWHEFFKSE
jgi:hypothetical protein